MAVGRGKGASLSKFVPFTPQPEWHELKRIPERQGASRRSYKVVRAYKPAASALPLTQLAPFLAASSFLCALSDAAFLPCLHTAAPPERALSSQVLSSQALSQLDSTNRRWSSVRAFKLAGVKRV